MKLFNKTDSPFLSKRDWRRVFTAMSIMTIALYAIAMVFSLLGSDVFIVKYQNESMDRIESFVTKYNIYSLITCLFLTIEVYIDMCFVSRKIVKIWYPLAFYLTSIGIAFLPPTLPSSFYSTYAIAYYTIVPVIVCLIETKKFDWKMLIRSIIATGIGFAIQAMIYVIKAGYFSVDNHILSLSGFFIYSFEYDIALSVLLFTLALYIDKGKGDGELWIQSQAQSGFSQTSKTRLQKSALKKTLSKKQKNKLFWLWVRIYLIQILGFALIMILPFVMGKVLEFLTMYFAFCVVRALLGFKYSLHFKNEFLCITVGAVVFGILTLAVPFFLR